MFTFNIILLILAATLTMIQVFKDYHGILKKIVLLVITASLGVSIKIEIDRYSEMLNEANDREIKHKEIIKTSDSTLKQTNILLNKSNDLIQDLQNLSALQKGTNESANKILLQTIQVYRQTSDEKSARIKGLKLRLQSTFDEIKRTFYFTFYKANSSDSITTVIKMSAEIEKALYLLNFETSNPLLKENKQLNRIWMLFSETL